MEKALAALALVFAISGCASSTGIPCEALSIHVFADASVDALTDDEVNQEQAYNELIAARCQ